MRNRRTLFVTPPTPRLPGKRTTTAYGRTTIRTPETVQPGKFIQSKDNILYGEDMPDFKARLVDAGKQAAKQAGNAALEAGTQYVTDKITDAANTLANRVSSGTSGISGQGRDTITGSSQAIPTPGQMALSPSPNPRETHLKTGIKLTILEKPFQDASENVCAPMHVSCAFFGFPTSSSSLIKDFFDKVIVYETQTSAQDNVNWAIDLVNKFSGTQILTAMNSLFYALQIYFFYRSIDVYSRNPDINVNFGLKTIREQFDYDTLAKLTTLNRILARTPIPPNMLEFCRYLNSNYLSGDTPGSSVIKIAPHKPVSVTQFVNNAEIQSAIDLLTDATTVGVYTTLFRAVKNWVLFDPSKLYDPPIELLYDKDFITIFNNLPFVTNVGTTKNYPQVASASTNYNYNSYTNVLDGAAVALTDAWVTGFTTPAWGLGLINIPSLTSESRFSYYKVGTTTGWYSPTAYDFLRQSRQDTYQSNGTAVTARHTFASDMVENISPNMQKVAGTNFMNWLMSNSTIKRVRPMGQPGSGRGRRRGK